MEHEQAVENLAVECYLLGEMSAAERASFEEHYFECAVCAEEVRDSAQFIEDAKDIFASGRAASPARAREIAAPSRTGWAWQTWMPQAAGVLIATLGVVAGIETFSTIPGLRREVSEFEAPRMVRSVVLRPVTRGDAAVVNEKPGEPVILVFDPPDSAELAPRTPLEFIVKSADGHVYFDVTGEAPTPGEQITLSEPRFDLPAGNYTLIVEGSGSSGKAPQDLGEYPFKLVRQ